jgi:hypothetical protein
VNTSVGRGRVFEGGSVIAGRCGARRTNCESNSRDDPNRIAPKMRKISINRAEFEFRFAPFDVTLLELELRPADRRQWRRTGALPFFLRWSLLERTIGARNRN